MMALVGNDLATCAEKQVATMSLGRLFVLVNGDQEMARLLLPLLLNGMLGSEKAPIQVGCILFDTFVPNGYLLNSAADSATMNATYKSIWFIIIYCYKTQGLELYLITHLSCQFARRCMHAWCM